MERGSSHTSVLHQESLAGLNSKNHDRVIIEWQIFRVLFLTIFPIEFYQKLWKKNDFTTQNIFLKNHTCACLTFWMNLFIRFGFGILASVAISE